METLGFIGKQEWKFPTPSEFEPPLNDNEDKVKIKRTMTYFWEGQPGVTLGKVREFYTEKAVKDLFFYGYIEKWKE